MKRANFIILASLACVAITVLATHPQHTNAGNERPSKLRREAAALASRLGLQPQWAINVLVDEVLYDIQHTLRGGVFDSTYEPMQPDHLYLPAVAGMPQQVIELSWTRGPE